MCNDALLCGTVLQSATELISTYFLLTPISKNSLIHYLRVIVKVETLFCKDKSNLPETVTTNMCILYQQAVISRVFSIVQI